METHENKRNKDVIKASEVAKAYGATVETVRRWAKKGWVKAEKIGKEWYFSKKDLSIFREKPVCVECGKEIEGYTDDRYLRAAFETGLCQSCLDTLEEARLDHVKGDER